MSVYITNEGDTFETIARNVFGDDKKSDIIAASNPGVGAGDGPFLTAGLEIYIPNDLRQRQAAGPVQDIDEVTLWIDGKVFEKFESIRITRVLDGIDSAEFTAPFNHDDPAHREAFRPFSYKDVDIGVGGKILFSGTMINVSPRNGPPRVVTVSAYALPGVLQDCTAPASAYPLEFNKLKLDEIARKLCEPFSIRVVFEDDAGPAFGRIAMSPGERVFAFLVKLAKQVGLIITSGTDGELIFKKSVTSGTPVANLSEDVPPLLTVSGRFNQQQYYSHLTGITPPIIGNLGGKQFTEKNPRLSGRLRPITFSMNNVDGADIKAAVAARLGYMFGDMASYTAQVLEWRDSAGDLWTPNTLLKILAPGAMIYNETTFIIREVTLMFTPTQKQTSLVLVLPGAYSGQAPESLPWE